MTASAQSDVFIQWKGTDVCLDFHCYKCNTFGHFDGYFAYYLRCPSCGQCYAMPEVVTLKPVDDLKEDTVQEPTDHGSLGDVGWTSTHTVGVVVSYTSDHS